MTTFEEATLALMEMERFRGMVDLIFTSSDLIATDIASFTTLLFGYLLAAYFIGSQLSTLQVSIFNLLYIAAASYNLLMLSGHVSILRVQMDRLREAFPDTAYTPITLKPEFLISGAVVICALIIASLYFMWSIRHHKTE